MQNQPSRRSDRFASVSRVATLSVALCALLIAGCTTGGGEQGAGDVAGRQAKTTVPGDTTAAAVLAIAESVRASGDLNSAISFYRRAIVIDPGLTKAYIGLGETLLAAGYANEAGEAFQKALGKEPKNPAALRGMGLTLVATNQAQAAVGMLNKAVTTEPSARAYSALGLAEDMAGDTAAADQAYRAGLELAPEDIDLLNNYGLSQAMHGDYDEAVTTLRRAASDSKAGPRNRLNLALALGLAGRTDDAAQVARIDLDERAVRSNLAYYATLRALPQEARVAAILRPGSPLPQPPANTCDKPPCGEPALPSDKPAAAPTERVHAKPLAAPAATKPEDQPATPPEKLTPPPAKESTPVAKAGKSKTTKTAAKPESKPEAATLPAQEASPAPDVTPAPGTSPATQEAAAPQDARAPQDASVPHDAASPSDVAAPQSSPADAAPQPQPAQPETHSEAQPAPNATTAATAPLPTADHGNAATQIAAIPEPTPSEPDPAQVANPPSAEITTSTATAAPQVAASEPPQPSPNEQERIAAEIATPAVPAPPAVPTAAPADAGAQPSEAAYSSGQGTNVAIATPSASAAKHTSWIQIAAYRTEHEALARWQAISTGNADLLHDTPFSIRRSDLGTDRGVFYRLRIGPIETASKATELCSALKGRQIDCFVSE